MRWAAGKVGGGKSLRNCPSIRHDLTAAVGTGRFPQMAPSRRRVERRAMMVCEYAMKFVGIQVEFTLQRPDHKEGTFYLCAHNWLVA